MTAGESPDLPAADHPAAAGTIVPAPTGPARAADAAVKSPSPARGDTAAVPGREARSPVRAPARGLPPQAPVSGTGTGPAAGTRMRRAVPAAGTTPGEEVPHGEDRHDGVLPQVRLGAGRRPGQDRQARGEAHEGHGAPDSGHHGAGEVSAREWLLLAVAVLLMAVFGAAVMLA